MANEFIPIAPSIINKFRTPEEFERGMCDCLDAGNTDLERQIVCDAILHLWSDLHCDDVAATSTIKEWHEYVETFVTSGQKFSCPPPDTCAVVVAHILFSAYTHAKVALNSGLSALKKALKGYNWAARFVAQGLNNNGWTQGLIPKPGAVFFRDSIKSNVYQHVGIVVCLADDGFYTVERNEDNVVPMKYSYSACATTIYKFPQSQNGFGGTGLFGYGMRFLYPPTNTNAEAAPNCLCRDAKFECKTGTELWHSENTYPAGCDKALEEFERTWEYKNSEDYDWHWEHDADSEVCYVCGKEKKIIPPLYKCKTGTELWHSENTYPAGCDKALEEFERTWEYENSEDYDWHWEHDADSEVCYVCGKEKKIITPEEIPPLCKCKSGTKAILKLDVTVAEAEEQYPEFIWESCEDGTSIACDFVVKCECGEGKTPLQVFDGTLEEARATYPQYDIWVTCGRMQVACSEYEKEDCVEKESKCIAENPSYRHAIYTETGWYIYSGDTGFGKYAPNLWLKVINAVTCELEEVECCSCEKNSAKIKDLNKKLDDLIIPKCKDYDAELAELKALILNIKSVDTGGNNYNFEQEFNELKEYIKNIKIDGNTTINNEYFEQEFNELKEYIKNIKIEKSDSDTTFITNEFNNLKKLIEVYNTDNKTNYESFAKTINILQKQIENLTKIADGKYKEGDYLESRKAIIRGGNCNNCKAQGTSQCNNCSLNNNNCDMSELRMILRDFERENNRKLEDLQRSVDRFSYINGFNNSTTSPSNTISYGEVNNANDLQNQINNLLELANNISNNSASKAEGKQDVNVNVNTSASGGNSDSANNSTTENNSENANNIANELGNNISSKNSNSNNNEMQNLTKLINELNERINAIESREYNENTTTYDNSEYDNELCYID
jgi:hypothetical protein